MKRQFEEHGINNLECIAQSYDGASVMSGAVSQTKWCMQRHYLSIALNLVLCYTCKAIPEARTFL